jgi:ABC transport system ATP-binding/permease protein
MLFAQNLSIKYGPKVILNSLSMSLLSGDRVALVGKNGAGKSTLLKILANQMSPDEGSVEMNSRLRVAYLAQEPQLSLKMSVLESVRLGMSALYDLIEQHRLACEQVFSCHDAGQEKNLQARIANLGHQIEVLGGFDIEHRVDEILSRLHISARDQLVENLSGGERRRVDLARVMLSSSDVYLLDEPTNHLDKDSIRFLVDTFTARPVPVLFVSHDKSFIDNVATRILEIEDGQSYGHDIPYANYLENRLIRVDISSRTLHRKERMVMRELAWLRSGTPARTTKQNARISRAENLINDVQKNDELNRQRNLDVRLAKVNRLGKTILELKNVGFTMNDRVLFEDVNLIVTAGDRYGIIGANGSGKTTLLRLINGEREPTTGAVVQGINTCLAQFDQNREKLDPELSLKESLVEYGDYVFVGEEKVHIASYLERFLFFGNEMNRKVETLSGGEQNRLLLAKLFKTPSNCLLLDEPTNDLDLSTLGILEDIINEYQGVVFIVSHDRQFLDRVCTGIIAFEPDRSKKNYESNVVIYQGDYTTYERLKSFSASVNFDEKAENVKKDSGGQRTKQKRTYGEQREYEGIEKIIQKTETARDAIQKVLEGGEIFRQDAQKAQELSKKLLQLDKEIAALYERWQYLESFGL